MPKWVDSNPWFVQNWVNNAWVNRPAIAILSDSGAVPFWGIQAVRREFKTTLSKPQQLGHDGRKLGKTTVGKPQESSVKAPSFLRVQPVLYGYHFVHAPTIPGVRGYTYSEPAGKCPNWMDVSKEEIIELNWWFSSTQSFSLPEGFILISWIIFTFFWDDGSSMFQLRFLGIFLTPLLHDFMEIKWPSFERTVMG